MRITHGWIGPKNFPFLRLKLRHTVSSVSADEIKAITDPKKAVEFGKSAGLAVEPKVIPDAPDHSALAVRIELAGSADRYLNPQLVIPIVDTTPIPRGSLLFNCLIPESEERAIIGPQQETILRAICRKVDALPFAVLTSRKEIRGQQYLGFRFFFGPNPEVTYNFMLRNRWLFSVLLAARKDKDYDPEERVKLAERCMAAKFVKTSDGRKIGHKVLEDIKIDRGGNPVLYDLRPAGEWQPAIPLELS